MDLAVPFVPMLARLERELPLGDFLYEPKWDGFRCLAVRSEGATELWSRHRRPLGRYFPEVVEALEALPRDGFVIDGELLAAGPEGFDFGVLMGRLHPSGTRVRELRRLHPATFFAFDLPAADGADLCREPYRVRRHRLERLLPEPTPPLALTPATPDPDVARAWLERPTTEAIDGVVAKSSTMAYRPGKRDMVKVKTERTAECVVAGFRPYVDDELPASLLLALHDGRELRHVGVASSFTRPRRRELLAELRPFAVPLDGHPWRDGFALEGNPTGRLSGSASAWDPSRMALDWVPLRPVLVCEVAYDRVDGGRFRHPARFVRWRPDRDAGSCTLDQL